jgi:hypothetical protein
MEHSTLRDVLLRMTAGRRDFPYPVRSEGTHPTGNGVYREVRTGLTEDESGRAIEQQRVKLVGVCASRSSGGTDHGANTGRTER